MDEAALDELTGFVEDHYARTDAPLLLSRLGQLRADLRRAIVDARKSFASVIRDHAQGRLEIIADDHRPGAEVVVVPSKREAVEARILADAAASAAAAKAFDDLPVPIRLAFCVASGEEDVYVTTTSPFRYEKVPKGERPSPASILVERKLRRPGLDLRTATTSDKRTLWTSFSQWAASQGVDQASFVVAAETASTNALSRLLEAQDHDALGRLRIPADIAVILLGLP